MVSYRLPLNQSKRRGVESNHVLTAKVTSGEVPARALGCRGKKWRCPKVGMPQNGWDIIYIVEKPIENDDLGGIPLF